MYTIHELSKIANISKRTLRYYDEINLLSPAQINQSNYLLYSDVEVDLLQQILFYKTIGYSLKSIKSIINNPSFDILESLMKQKKLMEEKSLQIQTLLKTIDQTINAVNGGYTMSNNSKFNGLREKDIQKNEALYGKEIRQKYGEDIVEESYKKMRKMSHNEYQKANELSQKINEQLILAVSTNNVESEEALTLCKMHQEWIKLYWPSYSKEAHLGLVTMYQEDERFKAYYENVQVGGTDFLLKAMKNYLQ
jgi:DNA-binding transcriptional MerR regulator